MDYINLKNDIDTYLLEHLSPQRYNHSVKVAEMSSLIAKKFDIDTQRAYIAGLAHDFARELSKKKQKKIIEKCGVFSDAFYGLSILYHGPVGAYLLSQKFDIDDTEILEAVKFHSIGNEDMGILAKIVYVADYISLDRKHIDNTYRYGMLRRDIDQMVVKVVESCQEHLKCVGDNLLPETKKMYNKILRKIGEEEKGI